MLIPPQRNLTFHESDIRAAGDSVASYRTLAWNAFKRLSLPVTTEEAWRRTDIHNLPVDKFKFASDGAFNDLPFVREDLLKPLTDNQHGGQIVLTPGGVTIELEEKLSRQGVIFTDLKTAEQKHPELLEKMIGKTVNVEEGKFLRLPARLHRTVLCCISPKA